MQLGTRWRVGDTPPAQLPQQLVAEIRSFEAAHGDDLGDASWTLTYLEGLPRLTYGDGRTLTLHRSGEPQWLEAAEIPGSEDDDDAWLS